MSGLNIALLQSATHWHDPAANRAMFEGLFDSLATDTQLIVLPEMFSTGFTMDSAAVAETMAGPTVAWMLAQAARRDAVVCGSLVISEAGRYYNRFVWAAPDGSCATYDKRHLFRMAGEHEHYAAGGPRQVLQLGAWRVCPMICYDLRFPVWFRNTGDYDLLLCVANWPAPRRDVWNTLLRARAIENQAYVAAVNIVGTDGLGVVYSGGSGVYAPDGQVITELFDDPQVAELSLSMQRLQQLRAEFPVWQDADRFATE